MSVGQIERKTQDRIVKFFQKELGYEYLGNWEKKDQITAISKKNY